MRPFVRTLIGISLGAMVVATAPAAMARAEGCYQRTKYTSTDISFSTMFEATANCNGVYVAWVYTSPDYVRGRFYKDGSWQLSSYGWQWSSKLQGDPSKKIIGNTITGRQIKGQGYSYNQDAIYYF